MGASDLFEARLNDWLKQVEDNEILFRQHVYQNENLTSFDVRQHRARLFDMIANGEHIALTFLEWGIKNSRLEEVKPTVEFIDQRTQKLLLILREWHGSPDQQTDVPESFKQAMREIAEGNLSDLDV
jgi:hypothetical protein